MKRELLAISASLALATSMSASTHNLNAGSAGSKLSQQVAREKQPGDDRGRHKGGKDDPKGHKLTQEIAREKQPGDDRGRDKGGKDDPKGHKLV
jgi:hypothetical protein